MKRVIKYWNQHSSGAAFSDCGTEYSVLPILVEDSAGDDELMALAEQLGINVAAALDIEAPRRVQPQQITHAVDTGKTHKTVSPHGPEEEHPIYLGLVTLDMRGALDPVESIDVKLSAEDCAEICDQHSYSLADIGETQDGQVILVYEGWDWYHHLPLLGYSLESFLSAMDIDEESFSDSVFRCDQCGLWDYNDDGYNHLCRMSDGEIFGMACGCWAEHCQNSIEAAVNDSREHIEVDVANSLADKNKLEHLGRYIGGQTDGRGGSYGGEACDAGVPEDVLQKHLKDSPDGSFVFTLDTSGWFKTYFSIWRVV